MENVFDIWAARGFLEQVTDEEGLRSLLASPQTLYAGFDPTAPSLHLGNLIPILGLVHAQRCGHRVLVVLGGATGMIGDPSGKSVERSFLDEETLAENLRSQREQFARLIDFTGERFSPAAEFRDNLDWTRELTVIEWLRDTGKLFSVNAMVAKESIRRRFEEREAGISFTEFSYMLLQAYDFYHLYKEEGCRLQVGGNDQWGNITAGIDLIRRKGGETAFGATFPLLTTAAGEKFGKSEQGAVWLDPERTSAWDFYQYFVRTDDRDAVRFLKLFTFLPLEEIDALAEELAREPEARAAQKRLAWEVTALVHGEAEADRMARGARALYEGRLEDLDGELIRQVFAEGPVVEVSGEELRAAPTLVDFAPRVGLVTSKGEARRMLKQGALYVNLHRAGAGRTVGLDDVLPAGVIVLRKGKREYLLVRVV